MKKKIKSIIALTSVFVLMLTFSLQAESRGKWRVNNLDESENGIVVADMECKYSLFVKECITGRVKSIVAIPE